MLPEVQHSEIVYRGRAFVVRRDRVRFPNGHSSELDIVDHPGAVTLVPIDRGQVCMVRQYRHSAGQVLLELPAGTLEPGEDPRACAARECREEIGMAPARLVPIGEAFLAPGYSTEYMYFYLATELSPAPLDADLDEDLALERVPIRAIPERIASGELRDAKSLAALFLAREWLED
ncbi:MAG TPA: NUDIX hydrolase [Anaerolineales bacterium]|nr:NUDIX hydrolase [Anaerolineales bacterium]